METLKYDFKTKFMIARSGEEEEVNFIEIIAPTNRVIRHVTVIDRESNKAMYKFSKDAQSIQGESNSESTKSKDDIESSELLMMLTAGGGDLDKCYTALKSILVLDSKVNIDIKFTETMFNKMNFEDTKNILGEYIKFFLAGFLNN